MSSETALDEKKVDLVGVKREAILAVINRDMRSGNPPATHVPSDWMDSLDRMFDSLGVGMVGRDKKELQLSGFDRRDGPKDYLDMETDIWGYDILELCTKSLGDIDRNSYLLIGPPDSQTRDHPLYNLIIVSGPVVARDRDEVSVVNGLVNELDLNIGPNDFGLLQRKLQYQYSKENPGRIRFQQPLDKDTILSPGETITRILSVPKAYAAFRGYQIGRDREIGSIVNGLVEQVRVL